MSDDPIKPCSSCKTHTHMGGKCEVCFAVESALREYLSRGGERARDFVEGCLMFAPVRSVLGQVT